MFEGLCFGLSAFSFKFHVQVLGFTFEGLGSSFGFRFEV